MIRVRKSKAEELLIFCEMEKQSHAEKFVNSSDLKQHQKDFNNPNLIYLSIENFKNELAGYFILAIAPKTKKIEFRRIIVDQNNQGIGQIAIGKMEAYCKETFHCKNIWLDVYQDNSKGIHIYEKLGYVKSKEEKFNNRILYFYEKNL